MSQIPPTPHQQLKVQRIPEKVNPHPDVHFSSAQTPNQKSPTQPQVDIRRSEMQAFFSSVGVLHTIWANKSNKVHATNIGTGFMLSPHLIMTCTHNLYTNRLLRYGDYFQFVPGIKQGQKPSDSNILRAKIVPAALRNDLSNVMFEIQPNQQELCLLYVQKPIFLPPDAQFPKIGNLEQMKFDYENDKLTVAGYPSMYFQSLKFRQNKTIKLIANSGKLFSLKNGQTEHPVQHDSQKKFMIHYNIKTSVGVSGSPVFATNKYNEIVVVGIHTHSGRFPGKAKQKPGFNSGLYFTDQILERIRHIEKCFTDDILVKIRQAKAESKERSVEYQKIKFYEDCKKNEEQIKYQLHDRVKSENHQVLAGLAPKASSKGDENKDDLAKNQELPVIDQIPFCQQAEDLSQNQVIGNILADLKEYPKEDNPKQQPKGRPRSKSLNKQEKILPEQLQFKEDNNELYSNKSALSLSGFEEELYQNLSWISKTQYEWLVELQDFSYYQRYQPLSGADSNDEKYQLQSDHTTNLRQSSFLSFI